MDNVLIAIVSFSVFDVINFELTLSFKSGRFSTCPKSQEKNLNILRTKRDFKMK